MRYRNDMVLFLLLEKDEKDIILILVYLYEVVEVAYMTLRISVKTYYTITRLGHMIQSQFTNLPRSHKVL